MADPEQEQELVEQSVRDTEDELMKTAFEPTPKEEPAEPPGGRARDPETGRFTKAASQVPVEQAAEQTAPPAEPEEPKRDEKEEEILPSWRAREINEERRRALAELEAMRVEHARLQAWAAQQQRAAQPEQQQQAPPDPLLDPLAYTKFVEGRFQAELARRDQQAALDRLNNNLERTHDRYGERFVKAYEALVIEGQRGNQQLVYQLASQANPGEAIVRWHAHQMLLQDTGGDLAAYDKKREEALLNNPEFLARAAERARLVAQGGGQQKPNTVVKMPPSLSKATGTADVPQTATDGSEAALFNFAMQPKQRR